MLNESPSNILTENKTSKNVFRTLEVDITLHYFYLTSYVPIPNTVNSIPNVKKNRTERRKLL